MARVVDSIPGSAAPSRSHSRRRNPRLIESEFTRRIHLDIPQVKVKVGIDYRKADVSRHPFDGRKLVVRRIL